MPRRTPVSKSRLDSEGCQMQPKSAELFGRAALVLFPFTSPTTLRSAQSGSSPFPPFLLALIAAPSRRSNS
jgi:hypothetical protein